MRDKVVNLLKIAISLGLLALLVWKVGWRETWETVSQIDPRYLLAAWTIYVFSMLLRGYRWQVLLQIQRLTVPLSRLVTLYFIGTFFNSVLPTGFGGDVVRMLELTKASHQRAKAVGTVLVDRLTGFVVLFAMATVALPFSYQLIPVPVTAMILIITALTFLGVWLALSDRVWRWIHRLPLVRNLLEQPRVQHFRSSIAAYRTPAIANALLASLLFNVLLMVINYLIALGLGVRISLWYFLIFIPVISFLLALPVSFSGLGVREGGYVLLFAQAGVPSSLALAMSLCVYAMAVATGLIGGVLYALQGYRGLGRPAG